MRSARTIIIIDCCVYCLCLLGLWQVAEKADLPFSFSDHQSKSFVIRNNSTRETRDGVLDGDLVLSVNGVRPGSLEDIEFILDGLKTGSSTIVKVERGTEELDIPVTLVRAYGDLYLVVAWLVGTLFFLSGLIVLVHKPDDISALVYHFGAVGVAAIIMTTWGSYATGPAGLGQTIRGIFSTAYIFVPVLLLHLSLVFPSRKKNIPPNILMSLYAIACILSLGMVITFFKATLPFSIPRFHTFMLFFNVTRCVYAICVVLSIVFFITSYRSSREEMERRKLRWVFLGLAISSLGFVSLWQIPQLLTSQGLVKEEFIILLSSATPLAFSVAIVRYHLLDIDLIVNRGTVYFIVLAIILSVYAIIVGATSAFIERFTVSMSIFVSAFAAVVVGLMFEPVRKKAQAFVDRSFFRIRYDMKEVEQKFTDQIKACVASDELADLVVKAVKGSIPVERIGYFTLARPGNRLHLLAHENFDILSIHSIEFEYSKLETTLCLPVIVEGRVEPGVKFERADVDVFHRWKMTVVLTLKSEDGSIIGFLVLGEKKSGLRYSIEDIDLLTSLRRQAEIAYDRILLQKKLVFEHEERERLEELNRIKTYFVSSVSHDLKTPLAAIRMFTEMLRSGHKITDRKFHHYLETIEGESKRLTRLIDNVLTVAKGEHTELVYDLHETSLKEIVQDTVAMIDYELHKEKRKVKVRLSGKNNNIFGDRDTIMEALANLISNAAQYSKRGKAILIETFNRNRFACVSVKDHGIGIPEDELAHIFEPFYRGRETSNIRPGGTGLGLSVAKSIMDAHNGKIEIESVPNSGTKVTLVFPIKEKT